MRAFPLLTLSTLLAWSCAKEAPALEPVELPSAHAEAPRQAPCVYFKQLRPFLPAGVPGYRTSKDEGSTGKYGDISVSEAERVFSGQERELAIRIVDTTVSERLGEKIKAAARDARFRAPTDPTAPLLLGESVGFVRFDPGEGRVEANLLVGDRFVVALTGRGFEDTTEVRELAKNLDLAGLSKLR